MRIRIDDVMLLIEDASSKEKLLSFGGSTGNYSSFTDAVKLLLTPSQFDAFAGEVSTSFSLSKTKQELLHKMKKQQEQDREKKIEQKKNLPDGYRFLNEFHTAYPEAVSDAFRKFITKIGTASPGLKGGKQFGRQGWASPYSETIATDLQHKDGEAILDLFEDLCKNIGKEMQKARQQGLEEGQNLLFQLHSGDITIKDLDKKLNKQKKE